MLVILAWLFGLFFTFIGVIWLLFNLALRPAIEAEVEMMKRGGKFEGEPEYMRTFRVARSEYDLETNARNKYRALATLSLGVFILGTMLIRSVF